MTRGWWWRTSRLIRSFLLLLTSLSIRRRRLAGAERGSRGSQVVLDPSCERVRASKHAFRNPCGVLERCHGLAEIVERGGGVVVRLMSQESSLTRRRRLVTRRLLFFCALQLRNRAEPQERVQDTAHSQ